MLDVGGVVEDMQMTGEHCRSRGACPLVGQTNMQRRPKVYHHRLGKEL